MASRGFSQNCVSAPESPCYKLACPSPLGKECVILKGIFFVQVSSHSSTADADSRHVK